MMSLSAEMVVVILPALNTLSHLILLFTYVLYEVNAQRKSNLYGFVFHKKLQLQLRRLMTLLRFVRHV